VYQYARRLRSGSVASQSSVFAGSEIGDVLDPLTSDYPEDRIEAARARANASKAMRDVASVRLLARAHSMGRLPR